jgi:hypothetical protein
MKTSDFETARYYYWEWRDLRRYRLAILRHGTPLEMEKSYIPIFEALDAAVADVEDRMMALGFEIDSDPFSLDTDVDKYDLLDPEKKRLQDKIDDPNPPQSMVRHFIAKTLIGGDEDRNRRTICRKSDFKPVVVMNPELEPWTVRHEGLAHFIMRELDKIEATPDANKD